MRIRFSAVPVINPENPSMVLPDRGEPEVTTVRKLEFTAAEIGALAHLYRGEVYRSTVWRTRLDNTTNWAVAGLGLALSVSFSRADASALPILLMGVLTVVFLFFEAR